MLRVADSPDERNVFGKMSQRNVVSWTAILNVYVRFRLEDEVLWVLKDCYF